MSTTVEVQIAGVSLEALFRAIDSRLCAVEDSADGSNEKLGIGPPLSAGARVEAQFGDGTEWCVVCAVLHSVLRARACPDAWCRRRVLYSFDDVLHCAA